MSDEVKRLCNLIIRHVADGATIFEKDHAAMIDTMRSQQAEIERLREALSDILKAYSEPDKLLCCNGEMCVCRGSTEREKAEYLAIQALNELDNQK